MSPLLISQIICNCAAIAWVIFWLCRVKAQGEA